MTPDDDPTVVALDDDLYFGDEESVTTSARYPERDWDDDTDAGHDPTEPAPED